jgi:EAL and modified HD-GYP domain-containing signal transduction protein
VSSSAAALAQDPKYLRFVARQPIFDRQRRLFGYELLFRDSWENSFGAGLDADIACRSTLDSSLLMGLDQLCENGIGFFNCTRETLMNDYMTLLPKERVVLEILETITPDQEVMEACIRLKTAGYRLALDDFLVDDPRRVLVPLADMLKVDWMATTPEQCRHLVDEYTRPDLMFLAEKIETPDDLKVAMELGFHYFQGYFFQKPVILHVREISPMQIHALSLLREVSRAVVNLNEVEKQIKTDASLVYRLLRYLNSSAFFFTAEIRSVRHALMVLGEKQIRKWVALVVTLHAGAAASTELIRTALTRARFCETLAPHVSGGSEDLFFLGLMSLLDVILELPLAEMLDRVPSAQEIKAALLGEPSPLAAPFELALAQETGNWQRMQDLAQQLHLDEVEVSASYWRAVAWAKDACQA